MNLSAPPSGRPRRAPVPRPSVHRGAVRRLAWLAAPLLLSACNLAPDYHRPASGTPTAFKEAAAPAETGWKTAEPRDDAIRAKWWEIYGDSDLNRLEEQVQVSNQSLLASEAAFRSARALVVSARSALFPTVTTSPSYVRERVSTTSHGSTLTTTPGGGAGGSSSAGSTGSTSAVSSANTPNPVNEFTLPFDVSYDFDLWRRLRNTEKSDVLSAIASAADVATAQLSLQSELAQDYFQVRALDAEQRIYDETIESYRQSVDLVQSLFNNGIDSDEDVATAQTQLATAVAQGTDLGVARAQYEHAIAVLIGRPPANFALAPTGPLPVPPAVPVALPSQLLERRPDIAAAERRVGAANAQIGVARAAYYPDLTLSAAAGFETSQVSQWFEWPSRFWSVGPQLAETLFDGGARRALNEQAEAAYDQTVANYRQTVLTAFQGVEDNLSALRILALEGRQQHLAVAAARHFLDLAMTRYKMGIDSYLNVMTAQTTVLTNREAELEVQLKQMTASVSLVMALGGGWNPNELPKAGDLTKRPPHWSPADSKEPEPPAPIESANPPPVKASLPGA